MPQRDEMPGAQRGKRGEREALERSVARDARRIARAQRERRTVLAQLSYLGALGMVFVLPVIGGAFLGDWLDSQLRGYSIHWTMSLIFLGVVVGAVNVWLMLRE